MNVRWDDGASEVECSYRKYRGEGNEYKGNFQCRRRQRRLPVSVASAGQIIVRGLGDRYSTTTLNGLPIASPNPDHKLIPLDLFPSSTVKNITVSKVYEANSFADYSGAHIDIGKRGKRAVDW